MAHEGSTLIVLIPLNNFIQYKTEKVLHRLKRKHKDPTKQNDLKVVTISAALFFLFLE